MKCIQCNSDVLELFNYCHKCGKPLRKSSKEEDNSKSKPQTSQPQTSQPLTFQQFRKRVSSERLGKGKKSLKQETPSEVLVNVGILKLSKGVLKPSKGKVMLVRVPSNIRKLDLLRKAIDKHAAYDKYFDPHAGYTLAYPDGTEVLTIPGQPSQLFQLDKYKDDIGKPYNRLTLFLVERELLAEMKESDHDSESDSEVKEVSTFKCKLSKPTWTSTSTSTSPSTLVGQKEAPSAKPEHSTLDKDQGKSSGISVKIAEVITLKEMFPDKNESELKGALDASNSLEEAVNLLILSNTNKSVNDIYETLIADDIENNVYDNCIYDNEYPSVENSAATETFSSNTELQNLLLEQSKKELKDSEYFRLKIRRQEIWEDTFFKWKRAEQDDFTKHIKVQFIGEPAVDHGGPSREFFNLLNTAAQSKLIYNGTFRHNIASLDEKEFYFYGQLTAFGLLQGFPGPKCFSKTVVDYILSGEIGNLKPSVEEIPNTEIKESLQKLVKITDEQSFKNEASFNFDHRFEAGYCKPLVNLKDKEDLCRLVSLHNVILSSVTEINQYMEGLKTCGILQLMKDNPELFRKTLEIQIVGLSADLVDNMFDPQFSPKDSNMFSVEQKIIFNFAQYLEDIEQRKVTSAVEGKEIVITLRHVLQFVTGADDIPAVGFTPRPTIHFTHNVIRKMFTNTCANSLTIPVAGMEEYSKFSSEFTFCMMNSPGFGNL